MHSFGYRANALLTFAVTILAFICAIASFSDNFSNQTPSAQIQILNINWFQKQPHGNDEVSLTLNITADLQSLFTWNTKQVFAFVAAEYETSKNSLNQVSLWDAIIPEKEHAKFWIQISNKYRVVLLLFNFGHGKRQELPEVADPWRKKYTNHQCFALSQQRPSSRKQHWMQSLGPKLKFRLLPQANSSIV